MKRQMMLVMMMPLLVLSRIPASIFRPPFNFTWPTKKASDVEGDLILGGLMMIHERQENFTCGPVMPQGGIQVQFRSIISFVKMYYSCYPIFNFCSINVNLKKGAKMSNTM